MGLSIWKMARNPPAMQELQETQVQSLGQEDPQEEEWQPTLVFLPGEPHGLQEHPGSLKSMGVRKNHTQLKQVSSVQKTCPLQGSVMEI